MAIEINYERLCGRISHGEIKCDALPTALMVAKGHDLDEVRLIQYEKIDNISK